MNNTVSAIAWAALGTFLFTLTYASSKLTGGEVSVFQIMFIRYVSGFSTLLIVASLTKTPFTSYRSNKPLSHFYRSICGSIGGICIVHASVIAPIADVTALGLTDGLITVLLSVIFLRERLGKHQWIGGVLCAAGAFVVVWGSTSDELLGSFSFGLWLALLGALLISVESILIKVLTFSEKPITILLYVNLFSMLILSIPAFYNWETPGLAHLMFFILLGPISIFAQYCWILAYRLEEVAVVTPINYLWIVFAAFLGYAFFNETPELYTLLGSSLIVLGGIVLSKRKKRMQLAQYSAIGNS